MKDWQPNGQQMPGGQQAPDSQPMPADQQTADPAAESTIPPENTTMPDQAPTPANGEDMQGNPAMNLPRGMASPNGGMGLMAGANESCLIQINGGTIIIDAQGDGLDSNGYLEINGGTVLINGSALDAESTMDYEYGSTITGGTVLFVGSAGMGETFGQESSQAFINTRTQGATGNTVQLKDAAGVIVAELTAARNFQCIIASAPGMTQGDTYTISVNGTDITTTVQ